MKKYLHAKIFFSNFMTFYSAKLFSIASRRKYLFLINQMYKCQIILITLAELIKNSLDFYKESTTKTKKNDIFSHPYNDMCRNRDILRLKID